MANGKRATWFIPSLLSLLLSFFFSFWEIGFLSESPLLLLRSLSAVISPTTAAAEFVVKGRKRKEEAMTRVTLKKTHEEASTWSEMNHGGGGGGGGRRREHYQQRQGGDMPSMVGNQGFKAKRTQEVRVPCFTSPPTPDPHWPHYFLLLLLPGVF